MTSSSPAWCDILPTLAFMPSYVNGEPPLAGIMALAETLLDDVTDAPPGRCPNLRQCRLEGASLPPVTLRLLLAGCRPPFEHLSL